MRHAIREKLTRLGLTCRTDMLGNLMATIEGDTATPSVMLLTHMDQLGFVVRKIEADGFVRVERLGGVPERALASQAVLLCVGQGRDRKGVIANKSHHATTQDEKYRVVPYSELCIDAGFGSAEEAQTAGVKIGTPVTYLPSVVELGAERVAGTSVDDRAGCAVVLEAARLLKDKSPRPTVHLVFAVQEEFNLRGAVTAAQALAPGIAIQIDLVLATDTPDMAHRGDVKLGGGPAMSLYSFHGRGTLNGLIPHPALVGLFENIAGERGTPLQRSAHVGALTETSYVQLVGSGVACIDMGFPMRYSHSSLEVCDLGDLEQLTRLLADAIAAINPKFSLDRDDYVT